MMRFIQQFYQDCLVKFALMGTHLFRHHVASALAGNGIARPVISETPGHTAPKSLDCYLSADIQHLREYALSIEPFPVSGEVLPL